MYRRVLSAWLIALTLLAGTIAPVRAQQEDAGREEKKGGPETEEEKITLEEAREAVQIAELFVKSFEEKNYPLSLIDELYVKDFDTRLRQSELKSYIYLASVEPEVVAKATDSDLRRLYVASLNYIYAGLFLYGVHSYNRKLRGEENDDDDPPPSELLPPEALAVLKGDPLIAALIEEEERQERRGKSEQADVTEQRTDKGTRGEEEPDGVEIRSLERLRSFVSTLEKASVLIREHIKRAQGPHTWKELTAALQTVEEGEGRDDGCEAMCPRLLVLSEDFFRAPKGTRLICVNVMALHMDLIRIDGRLRILNVYIASD